MKLITPLFIMLALECSAEVFRYEGIVKASIEFDVLAGQSGELDFDVEEGGIILAEDPVAHVNSQRQKFEMNAAGANMRAAELDLVQKQMVLANEQVLLLKGTLSANALKETEVQAIRAQADYDREQANYVLKKYDFERTRFTSPVGALFIKKYAKAYNYVNEGEKIARLINADQVEVEIYPNIQNYPCIHLEDKVEVRLDSERQLQGRVVFVSPQVDTASDTFRVKLSFDNVRDPEAKNPSEHYMFLPGTLVNVFVNCEQHPHKGAEVSVWLGTQAPSL